MDLNDIQEDLDFNANIQENIRGMIKEVFSDIYNFLGERNFKRWLLDNHIKSVARRAIYRELTPKQDEVFKQNKSVVGYRTSEGKLDKIVLKSKVGTNKSVAAHETFHAFVDGYGGFHAFLGEGITEYMNRTLYNAKEYSYKQNVDMVSLIYAMYSDRIIKYYLARQGQSFFFDISKEVDPSLTKYMQDNNFDLEKHLDKFQELVYGNEKKSPYANDTQHELKQGVSAVIRNFYIYKRDEISKLKYINNGKVDFNRFADEMAMVSSEYHKLGGDLAYFNDLTNFLIDELLENSHLLVVTDEESKKNLKETLTKNLKDAIAIKTSKYNIGLDGRNVGKIDQNEEPYRSLNTNQADKLIKKLMQDTDSQIDFAKKIEILSNIERATNLNKEKLSEAIQVEGGKEINCDSDLLCSIADRYSVTISNLNAIEIKNEQEFESPRYAQVELGCMPHKRAYLEGIDNNFSLLILDDKTGEVNHISLSKYGELLPEKGIFVRQCDNTTEAKRFNLPEEVKYKENVFEIFSMETKQSTYIGFDSDLIKSRITDDQSVKISNGRLDTKIHFFDDIRKEFLARTVFESMYQKIEEGEYTSNKTENNSSYMFYDNFVEEYNTIKGVFKGIDEEESELKYLSGKLMDSTFKIEQVPYTNFGQENEWIKETYKQKRKELQRDFVEFARAKTVGKNTEHVIKMRGQINGKVFEINSALNSVRRPVKIFEDQKSDILKSAISATEKTTRTDSIQAQIDQMQMLVKGKDENIKRKEDIEKTH